MQVPIVKTETNIFTDTVYVNFQKNSLSGSAKADFQGYAARFIKEYLRNLDPETKNKFYQSIFQKGNKQSSVSVNNISGLENRDTTLVIDYDFNIPGYLKIKDENIYFNPFLKKDHSEEKINTSTEKLDKANQYKKTDRTVTIFNIPKGYTLDYLPESISNSTDFFSYSIELSYNKTTNQITTVTEFQTDHLILSNKDFESWNVIIKELNEIYSELIILKKTN